MTSLTKGILSITLSAFGFAAMAACVRLCDEYGAAVPCFEKGFFRNAVALLIALPVVLKGGSLRGSWAGLGLRPGVMLLGRCVFGTVGIFANFYALSHIPIADGQALNKTAPFFTILFAALCLGERATLRQLTAMVLAFAGAMLVVRPGFAGGAALPLTMGLLGGVTAGAAYTLLRALVAQGVNPALVVLAFSGFSCLASVPFLFTDFVPLTVPQVLTLLGAGAGAAVGQFGISFAYRYAPPKEIAVYDYSSILFAALLGYLLFGQVSDALSWTGMAVIVAAAVTIHLGRKR